MAIARPQLLKELLPGLNALFGLEYEKYENEHAEIYDTESSERSFEEEVKLSGLEPLRSSRKVLRFHSTQRRSHLRPVTTTKPWQWAFQSQRKQ